MNQQLDISPLNTTADSFTDLASVPDLDMEPLSGYKSAAVSAKGRRQTNEDQEYVSNDKFFLAVFDGHGGSEAAEVALENV